MQVRRNREKKEQHVASSGKKVAKGMQEKKNRERKKETKICKYLLQ